jgi:hypothetical protein
VASVQSGQLHGEQRPRSLMRSHLIDAASFDCRYETLRAEEHAEAESAQACSVDKGSKNG